MAPQRRKTVAQRNVRTAGFLGRPELKYYDTADTSATAVATAGIIRNDSLVDGITQGSGPSGRLGNRILVKKVLFNYSGHITSTATPGDACDILRFMIVQDKQCNGSAATVGEVLESANMNSFNDLETSSRFKILYNKFHVMNTFGAYSTQNSRSYIHFQGAIDCNIPVQFSASTGAVGDVSTNNIFVLAISENGEAIIDGQLRVRYLDR